MTTLAIETNGLTKRFGDVYAVDFVSLRLKIYSFPGLNCAEGSGLCGSAQHKQVLLVTVASLTALAATFYWWRNADQTK